MTVTESVGAAWRSAVVLGCAAVCAAGGPVLLSTGATVLAAAVVLPAVARCRGRGPADAVLIAVGGLLAVAVLVGLTLNLLPTGLSRQGCSFGLAAVALTTLWLGARRPAPASPRPGRPGPGMLAAGVLAGLLVLASYGVAVRSTKAAESSPIQLSVRGGTDGGGPVQVVASSDTDLGPVELRLVSGNWSRPVGPAFLLQAGVPAVRSVELPADRVTVLLANAGQTVPIRSLIIDRRTGQ